MGQQRCAQRAGVRRDPLTPTLLGPGQQSTVRFAENSFDDDFLERSAAGNIGIERVGVQPQPTGDSAPGPPSSTTATAASTTCSTSRLRRGPRRGFDSTLDIGSGTGFTVHSTNFVRRTTKEKQ